MTNPQIRHATTDDVDRIARLITAAFFTLDAAAWLVRDPGERGPLLQADFAIYVDHALTHGEIHLVEDDSDAPTAAPMAAAVWFAQPTSPTPAPDDYETRLIAACGHHAERFHTLDQLFDDNHPKVYPHHHLAYLATRPDFQGRGLGTELLRHHHSRLDNHGIPAFLHASSKQSRDLYERHGYECLGDPFCLPDGPPFWSMWRTPRTIETNNTRAHDRQISGTGTA